jgi:hypothetical protein
MMMHFLISEHVVAGVFTGLHYDRVRLLLYHAL